MVIIYQLLNKNYMKICIVVADYYKDISKNLLKGSINELKKNGYKNIKLNLFQVHLKYQP